MYSYIHPISRENCFVEEVDDLFNPKNKVWLYSNYDLLEEEAPVYDSPFHNYIGFLKRVLADNSTSLALYSKLNTYTNNGPFGSQHSHQAHTMYMNIILDLLQTFSIKSWQLPFLYFRGDNIKELCVLGITPDLSSLTLNWFTLSYDRENGNLLLQPKQRNAIKKVLKQWEDAEAVNRFKGVDVTELCVPSFYMLYALLLQMFNSMFVEIDTPGQNFTYKPVFELPENETFSCKIVNYHKIVIKSTVVNDAAIRQRVNTLLNYSTDVCKLIPYVYSDETKIANGLLRTPTYGVELEVSTQMRIQDLIKSQENLFFACKQDGSITGRFNNRAELVTVPCTLKQHKRLWASFFNNVSYDQFDCSNQTTNGMHIHIDSKAFHCKKGGHLKKFAFFFTRPSNREFLYRISEREKVEHISKYSPFLSKDGTFQTYSTHPSTWEGTRGAINLGKKNTVEVRIFKGLVSYATIIKNLEFVDALVNYTKSPDIGYRQLTSYHFATWLESLPSNQYRTLRLFISKHMDPRLFHIMQLIEPLIDKYCYNNTMNHLYTPINIPAFCNVINLLHNVTYEDRKFIASLFPRLIFYQKDGTLANHPGESKDAILGEYDLVLQSNFIKGKTAIKPRVL